jgi:hypothetical protein
VQGSIEEARHLILLVSGNHSSVSQAISQSGCWSVSQAVGLSVRMLVTAVSLQAGRLAFSEAGGGSQPAVEMPV